MRFLLLVCMVITFVGGVFFSEHNFFRVNSKAESPKKLRAVKPKFLREKTAEALIRTKKPVYTFFKTLNDESMTSYVDLDGNLLPEKSKITKVSNPLVVAKVITPPLSQFTKIPQQAVKTPETDEVVSKDSGRTGYAVQVSSFRSEASAVALKMRLQKNGFNAFLMQTELPGGVWYRVFSGIYANEKTAQSAAVVVRKKFKLNAVVVSKTS